MITVEKALFLRQVSIFADLDSHALRRIAELAEEVVAAAGSTIFVEGETGDSFYLIRDGSVRIHRGEVELRMLESPAYFGEMSLLSDEPRSASATAVDDCLMLRIDRDGFREILMLYPQAALDVIRTLSRYLLQLEAERLAAERLEADGAEGRREETSES